MRVYGERGDRIGGASGVCGMGGLREVSDVSCARSSVGVTPEKVPEGMSTQNCAHERRDERRRQGRGCTAKAPRQGNVTGMTRLSEMSREEIGTEVALSPGNKARARS